MNSIATFVAILGALGLGDAAWLTYRLDFHKAFFQEVQKSALTVRILPAILVYVLLAIAIFLYAVQDANSLQDAAVRGALVGFLMYGFYDATNWATLNGWTGYMAITDTLWGTLAGALGATAGYWIMVKK
jgi:uncharacterized membrane protein